MIEYLKIEMYRDVTQEPYRTVHKLTVDVTVNGKKYSLSHLVRTDDFTSTFDRIWEIARLELLEAIRQGK